jgi:hypothetical protein
MTRQQFRKLIKEEIENVNLEEGLLDFVFGIAGSVANAIVDKHRDFLLANLKDDPEIRAMQRQVGASRDAMVNAFNRRYATNNKFQGKVNSLIKKIR